MLYSDIVNNHGINDNIEILTEKIEMASNEDDKTADDVSAIARLRQVVVRFNSAYKNCSKNFIAIKWLDESLAAIKQICGKIDAYCADKRTTHLTTEIYPQIDMLLLNITRFNCIKSRQNLDGAAEAFSAYADEMFKHNEILEGRVEELTHQVKDVNQDVSDAKESIDKKVAEVIQKFDKEQERLDRFADTYQIQKQEDQKTFLEFIEELKETFREKQEQNNNEFSETKYAFEKVSNSLIKQYEQEFDDYKRKVEAMVGILNANTFSHKYKEVANDAKKRAFVWHTIAISLLLSVVIFAVYAFIITSNHDTGWTELIAKIFATMTMATAATYAARQASKQEEVERYARRIEVELVAIDPFIQSLNEDLQGKIKEKLSYKIFGNNNAMKPFRKNDNKDGEIELKNLTSLLMDIVKKTES